MANLDDLDNFTGKFVKITFNPSKNDDSASGWVIGVGVVHQDLLVNVRVRQVALHWGMQVVVSENTQIEEVEPLPNDVKYFKLDGV